MVEVASGNVAKNQIYRRWDGDRMDDCPTDPG